MNIFESLILYTSFGVSISAIIGLILFFKRLSKLEKTAYGGVSTTIVAQVSEIFSENEIKEDKVEKLAKKLFLITKKKFNLTSTTYSEIVDELRESHSIKDNDLRKLLIDFFNDLISIQYQEKTFSSEQRSKFKNRILLIGTKLELPQKKP